MNLTISENVNDIIFNGHYVQKLIFNGHEIWSKGSTPGPTPVVYEYLDPHVDSEYYYNYTMSSQSSTWSDISLSKSYQQINFVDCSSVTLGDTTCDYGDVKLLLFCSTVSNNKYVPDASYVGKVKISDLIPSVYVDGLRNAILNAETTTGVYDNNVRDAILTYYNQILNNVGLYAIQVRDAYYTVANVMQKKNSNYNLPSNYLAQPDIQICNSSGTAYNIDDSTSQQITNTKIRLKLQTNSSSSYYYNNYNEEIYICSWYSILIMIYNYYWLNYLNETTIQKYTITVSSNNESFGTVSGGGQKFESTTCVLTGNVTDYGVFNGWYENGTLISTLNPYSFIVTGNRTIQGQFSERTIYTITATSEDVSYGSVSGGGNYYENNECTLTATHNSGYVFDGWYENGTLISSSNPYTFTVTGNKTIVCKYTVVPYTAVSYIKANATSYGYKTCYFNTGIYSTATSTLKITMKFYPLVNEGNIYFGHSGNTIANTGNDSADFRLFWYNNSMYCDCGNGRKYKGTALNKYYEFRWETNFSNKTYKIVDIINNTELYNNSFSSNPNNYPIYINLAPMKLKAISIEKDGTTVFDGIACLDENNIPCIYDNITNNYFYTNGINANNITYES